MQYTKFLLFNGNLTSGTLPCLIALPKFKEKIRVMTKKEERPRSEKTQLEEHPKDLDYNPDITAEDKKVLNNQSKDHKISQYIEQREEPIDFVGHDLDVPLAKERFNPTVNRPDDAERNRKPKDSADTHENLGPDSETIYKNQDAEKYRDPSEKTRRKD